MLPNKISKRSLHIPQRNELKSWFHSTRLSFVIFSFSGLAIVNVLTLVVGTQGIYTVLSSNIYTAFLSFVIYDSPGTIAGLLGIIVIFAVISLFVFLLTGEASSNRTFFFVITSITTGVASQIAWNTCCNEGGGFPAGSSAVDFAALACLIVYSITDSARLTRLIAEKRSRLWLDSRLTAIYLILVAGMLTLYAVSIQPIYIPTLRYNWRVHEFAFLSALVVSLVTEAIRSTRAPSSR